jgi:hypothetical protein
MERRDDVAATRRALTSHNGPTVLVDYSSAEIIYSEASNDPKVPTLMYVAASAP